ncbi:MAG: HEPN domain-containing protein [Fimbriimonadaceae bacterium]|nr:HEPN domain-containing protein [Fimbriimonadaceae bacterium]
MNDADFRRACESERQRVRLLDCSDDDFEGEMLALDQHLQEKNIPVHGRQLWAVGELCTKYGFSLVLGEPLANRVSDWMRARYEDRLKVDFSLGYSPVLIHGDCYQLKVPALFFGGYIIAIAPPTPRMPGRNVINVLDLIKDLPTKVANSLTTVELLGLQAKFGEFTQGLTVAMSVRAETHYKEALGDLSAASEAITKTGFEIGRSRWGSLQYAEKTIKAWILDLGEEPQKIHDLSKLAKRASELGLPPIDSQDLALAQCEPDVRYWKDGLTLQEAVKAYEAALRIGAHVVSNRPRAQRA